MTEADRRMFRYVVPVDDAAHIVPLTNAPVAAEAVHGAYGDVSVEFWAERAEGAPEVKRAFQVYGTGHPLPEGARWVATCPRTPYGLVFHLYEICGGGGGG